MNAGDVTLKDLQLHYPAQKGKQPFKAVEDVSLEIKSGEFVSIVGPSGCGKSTLLLAVDGLLSPTRGVVEVGGVPTTRPGPDRAMVFQEFALFPWRTVLRNVTFGLEIEKQPGVDAKERAMELLKLVGLEGFENHHPHQLSGGMRQRVGIARALAMDPDVLLMDEPFGALDAQTREIMGDELLKIWNTARKTVLFVTHGIDEAVFLADRAVVLTKGPARVADVIDIDLPRPRTPEMRKSAAYLQYREHIANLIFQRSPDDAPVEFTGDRW